MMRNEVMMGFFNEPINTVSVIVVATAIIALIIIGRVKGARKSTRDECEKKDCDKINSVTNLTDEMNRERERKGKYKIRPINSGTVSANSYAQKDKSYSNSLDFFVKLFKKK